MTTTNIHDRVNDPAYMVPLLRQTIASHYHFFNFRDIPDEWAKYQQWRASVSGPLNPAYVSWPNWYFSNRYNQAVSYRNDLVAQLIQHQVKRPAWAALFQLDIDAANVLITVYIKGVVTTEVNPKDAAAFSTAIGPMVAATLDTTIVQNVDDLPANAVAPSYPPPPPPTQTLVDRLTTTDPEFIGAKAQVPVAKAAGFYFKRFKFLYKGIPDPPKPGPGAPTGPGGPGTTGRGRNKAPTKAPVTLPPYNIVQEINTNPRPARMDFTDFGHVRHPDDYDDQYFIDNYKLLYDRVVGFGEKWFGDIDLGAGYVGSPWQETYNDQFIEYSRLVAHEDRYMGGWDSLLRDAKYRKWLVVGILGQIIQKRVFCELLFGVDHEWRDELDREDLSLIEVEGYRRKARRSETAKMALRGMFVPSEFWGEVDKLTWRACLIFEPLINLLDLYRAQTNDHQTDLRHFHQELHMIFQLAAFMQVCMAVSPSVFHHLSATPGARMDYPIEQQAEVALYRDSKEVNETLDAQWEEAQDMLAKGQTVSAADVKKFNDMYPMPLPGGTGGSTLTKAQYDQAIRTGRHHRLRGARIKLAVFPMLKRYKPENRGVPVDPSKPPTAANWHQVEGQRISDIFRCTVVYYQGLMYPVNAHDDGVPLDTYLTSVTGGKVRLPNRLSTAAILVICIFVLFVVYPFVSWLLHIVDHDRETADIWLEYQVSVLTSPFRNTQSYIQRAYVNSGRDPVTLACRAFCHFIYQDRCSCD